MKRIFMMVVLLVSIVVIFAGLVQAANNPIPGWADMRQDMEMAKGALKQAVGSTVLNTYLPDYGVIFMFTIKSSMSVEQVCTELEKVLRYLLPTIGLLEGDQKIALIGYSDGFLEEWEIIYVATKASSADPTTWAVYYNSKEM
jgi:hypothetical protein